MSQKRRSFGMLFLAVGICSGWACSGAVGAPPMMTAVPPDWLDRPGPLSPSQIVNLRPLYDHPPLQTAVLHYQAGDYAQALTILDSMAGDFGESDALAPSVLLLQAVTLRALQAHDRAAALLSECLKRLPVLADYIRYLASDSLLQANQADRAVSMALAVPSTSTWGPAARLQAARALLSLHHPNEALDVLLRMVPGNDGSAIQSALLLGDTQAALGQFRPAAITYWHIWSRHATNVQAGEAGRKAREAAAKIPGAEGIRLATPSQEDRLIRGRHLFAAHRNDQVVSEMRDLLGELTEGSKPWCEAHWMAARSHDKNRQREKSAPHYLQLQRLCPYPTQRADILYYGGRSAAENGRLDEALTWFEMLHKELPSHSYNDDALLREAQIYASQGKMTLSRETLQRALREYPGGDMRESIGWNLLWQAYREGNMAAVVAQADDLLKAAKRDQAEWSAGRTLYWNGRAQQRLNRPEAARDAWQTCVQTYPLTYYSALCVGQLNQIRAGLGQSVLAQAFRQSSGSPDPLASTEPLGVSEQPAFRRAVALWRLGLLPAARREIKMLRTSREMQPALDWVMALLFDRVGAHSFALSLARRRHPEFADRYPAARTLRYWQIAYPRPLPATIGKWSAATGLLADLVYAIQREESGFNPDIESWAGAVGLMQLMLPTAQSMAQKVGMRPAPSRGSLKIPEVNVQLGCAYLSQLLRQLGHFALAVAGYNAGGGRVRKWLRDLGKRDLDEFIESIPSDQTRGYTKRVMESFIRYRVLYGGVEAFPDLPLRLPSAPSPVASTAGKLPER